MLLWWELSAGVSYSQLPVLPLVEKNISQSLLNSLRILKTFSKNFTAIWKIFRKHLKEILATLPTEHKNILVVIS